MKPRSWPSSLQRIGLQRNSPTIRFIVLGATDILCWMLAWQLAVLVIGTLTPAHVTAELIIVCVLTQLALGAALSLYNNRFLIGSAAELGMMSVATAGVLTVLLLVAIAVSGPVAVPEVVLASVFAIVAMTAARQLLRAYLDHSRRPRGGARVLLVGAGEVGQGLVRQMLRDSNSRYLPVGFLDDDRAKRFLRVSGVPVLGPSSAARRVAEEAGADGIVVAIGYAEAELFRSLTAQLEDTDIWIRTLPPLQDQLDIETDIAQLRDINVEDLIGRPVTTIDMSAAAELIGGARVLVTGAGGSIGSELCRQLHRLNPAELVMVDRDESALHALSMSIHGRALMDSPGLVLADVRDEQALHAVFSRHRPEIVFHAAALKHLPMLERFPAEGWKTNVHGTLNVLRAADAVGTARFVNVSTDKAANPTSELGRSKLLAEGLTAGFARTTGRPYVSVRFGNVFGSRGSVLVSFAEQIRRGGPVTITHPDVTRYFMTVPEASRLVLQAAAIGQSGETLVLDMGEPVAIVDIARRMMALSGRHCPIAYTGLRPGEKLSEELFTPEELKAVQIHDRIWHVPAGTFAADSLPGAEASAQAIAACYRTVAADPADGTDDRSTAEAVAQLNQMESAVYDRSATARAQPVGAASTLAPSADDSEDVTTS